MIIKWVSLRPIGQGTEDVKDLDTLLGPGSNICWGPWEVVNVSKLLSSRKCCKSDQNNRD